MSEIPIIINGSKWQYYYYQLRYGKIIYPSFPKSALIFLFSFPHYHIPVIDDEYRESRAYIGEVMGAESRYVCH
jgi:hypothetical protein